MLFLQMSGFPGSGKSTLAREIAKFTKAVIIDHDIVKTGLLEGLIDPLTINSQLDQDSVLK
ncbi:hypothetical protein J23TS9_42420 [Paenibacillus sp. J23TS9]|nr:hypothetical protein J23TS9_42420 [Paenibacillus sp. J23TS9]